MYQMFVSSYPLVSVQRHRFHHLQQQSSVLCCWWLFLLDSPNLVQLWLVCSGSVLMGWRLLGMDCLVLGSHRQWGVVDAFLFSQVDSWSCAGHFVAWPPHIGLCLCSWCALVQLWGWVCLCIPCFVLSLHGTLQFSVPQLWHLSTHLQWCGCSLNLKEVLLFYI